MHPEVRSPGQVQVVEFRSTDVENFLSLEPIHAGPIGANNTYSRGGRLKRGHDSAYAPIAAENMWCLSTVPELPWSVPIGMGVASVQPIA